MFEMIGIGDKIELIALGATKDGERPKIYCSQVVDADDALHLKITMPMDNGALIPLTVGHRFSVVFYTKNGLYEAHCVILDRFKEGNLPLVLMELTSTLKKVQHRNYYRYECTMPCKYRTLTGEEKLTKEEMLQAVWLDGVILDLSGGGIRFVTTVKEEVKSLLQFKLVLTLDDVYEEIYVIGKVISINNSMKNTRVYEARIEFTKIMEPDREKIIQYIFLQERKKLSKDI